MTATLKQRMPLLARNEGVWEGWYRYYDAAGGKTDEHKSRLLCRFPGPDEYRQTNHYYWADGRKEVREFPSRLAGDRIVFHTEIDGWAAEVPLDENRRTLMLHWKRRNEPGLYLYEMIQLSDCGNFRARVWQWFRGDRLAQRTLVDERRVSDDWSAYEGRVSEFAEVALP
jgi:hypothetical protein